MSLLIKLFGIGKCDPNKAEETDDKLEADNVENAIELIKAKYNKDDVFLSIEKEAASNCKSFQYRVDIVDSNNGENLACFLLTDLQLVKANIDGIFEKYLTFVIVDSHYTFEATSPQKICRLSTVTLNEHYFKPLYPLITIKPKYGGEEECDCRNYKIEISTNTEPEDEI